MSRTCLESDCYRGSWKTEGVFFCLEIHFQPIFTLVNWNFLMANSICNWVFIFHVNNFIIWIVNLQLLNMETPLNIQKKKNNLSTLKIQNNNLKIKTQTSEKLSLHRDLRFQVIWKPINTSMVLFSLRETLWHQVFQFSQSELD